MTFGPQHYVPVLKVKRGEKAALRAISPTLRPRITPLLEIVERTKPTVTEHLDTAFKGLADSIGPYARCFLDTGEIAPDGPLAAAEVFDRATADGIVFTPITGITRSADIAAALNHRVHGLALRLTRQEFESGRLPSALPSFMTLNGLTPRETDLIKSFFFSAGASRTILLHRELPSPRRIITLSSSCSETPLFFF